MKDTVDIHSITKEEFIEVYNKTGSRNEFLKRMNLSSSEKNRIWFNIKEGEFGLPGLDRSKYTPRKSKMPDGELTKVVRESISIRECLSKLGLAAYGSNYAGFRKRVSDLGLDTSHFTGQASVKNKKNYRGYTRSLDSIMVENSTYTSTNKLNKRLVKEGILEFKCSECGILDWNGKDLALHLDHINGTSNDHRLENLRLLCPNCHSQTSTYAGKNWGKYKDKTN
jgi:5-methylcytosine-specific restriction endonuclease McrA